MQWCAILLFALFSLQQQTSATSKIKTEDGWFKDEHDRVRIFHGFNDVRKSFPWYNENLLDEERLKLYQSWGFNVVRMGAMWTGAYPVERQMNRTYVNILREQVDNAEAHGMHVLLDMHQDVISSAYGSYDGVPLWLIEKFTPPRHPYPWPLNNVPHWYLGYATEAVSQAFQSLYDNEAEAWEHYGDFWRTMAQAFNNKPSVLGYELINEPWAGDVFEKPWLALPGLVGSRNLMPMYDHLVSVIRRWDAETLVFFEPVTWSVMSNGPYIGSGFDRVPGGAEESARSVLSYHWYCQGLATENPSEDYKWWARFICDEILGKRMYNVALKDIQKLGCGGMLTEFGLCDPDGNPNSINTIECNFMMDEADVNFQSWAYWDSNFFDSEGKVRLNTVKEFARPYAMATAGIPRLMNWDHKQGHFQFEFIHDPSIDAPTELFIPHLHFPDGIDVKISDGFKWSFTDSIIHVTKKNKDSPDGFYDIVSVVVWPK